MTDFDVEFEGEEETLARFEELKEELDSDGITYVVGTAVEYGVYLEFGTKDMPPYPWYQPAIREFKANPERFIMDNTDFSSIDEIQNTKEMVATVATALQTQMEKNVNAQKSGDRSPGTHPEHPRRDTGNLTASIKSIRIS
jgi:phage gpG-like protein